MWRPETIYKRILPRSYTLGTTIIIFIQRFVLLCCLHLANRASYDVIFKTFRFVFWTILEWKCLWWYLDYMTLNTAHFLKHNYNRLFFKARNTPIFTCEYDIHRMGANVWSHMGSLLYLVCGDSQPAERPSFLWALTLFSFNTFAHQFMAGLVMYGDYWNHIAR